MEHDLEYAQRFVIVKQFSFNALTVIDLRDNGENIIQGLKYFSLVVHVALKKVHKLAFFGPRVVDHVITAVDYAFTICFDSSSKLVVAVEIKNEIFRGGELSSGCWYGCVVYRRGVLAGYREGWDNVRVRRRMCLKK